MAEERKPEGSGLTGALPVTVVLALLASLVFRNLSPYHDERPSNRPIQAPYAAAQDVDARLWQDPFAAVDGASEEPSTEKISVVASLNGQPQRLEGTQQTAKPASHGPDQLYKGTPVAAKDDFTILAVTLPGGPYQEAAENRMRRRYAVLSALANMDAEPQDEQHIGYFYPDRLSDRGLQKRVSFEWWSLPDSKKVLLLWVDESSLSGRPAAKLNELLRQASQEKPPKVKISRHTVIGPNTSTLLRDMMKEVEDAKHGNPVVKSVGNPQFKPSPGEINGHKVVYYAAGATASDEALLEGIEHAPECKTITKCLGSGGVTLYRTTATDVAMMKVLANELEVRRIAKKSDHIVILSEWDTFYGRAMPKAFEKAWGSIDGKDKIGETIVHVYGYMRGLDGKLPDKGDKTASVAEKKPDSKDKADADALIEFPEGQNQKDYLRRLTDSILELDQYLKDDGDKSGNVKGIAAIGVLGSDVHDKMMILEALRQHFPHRLFFTTDLDAAFSHRAKWLQTHNLLVASAFDLKLRHELHGKIPPFRDSYQTAYFLAAQMALNDEKNIADRIGIPDPRLFEIGRSRPIPLPTSIDKVSVKHRHDNNAITSKCAWTNLPACIPEFKGPPLPHLFDHSISLPTSQNTVWISRQDDNGIKSDCSWVNWPACSNTVQPRIFATSQLNWTWEGLIVAFMVAILLYLVSWRVRERLMQFTVEVTVVLLLVYLLTWIFASSQLPELHWLWGVGMVAIPYLFFRWWVLEREKKRSRPFKLHPYFALGVGLMLFLAYSHTPFWNTYITQDNAEPFYWLEGVSAWPSQLMRLLVVLFAGLFFLWGHGQIKKMQEDLQIPRRNPPTFSLPAQHTQLKKCDVLFVGSWEEDQERRKSSPDDLWKKYLGYCQQEKMCFPGTFLRVLVHAAAFFFVAMVIIKFNPPNVPVRGGDVGKYVNLSVIIPAVLATIFLTMWVVENARLCERLIDHLSAHPSEWNKKARQWAIRVKKVPPECVNEWLDIQLVVRLTKTLQPLIFGPVICLALLVLARSPVIDDWDLPWGLDIVLMVMLLYAIAAEVLLQRGAKDARAKAVKLLTEKISVERNRNKNPPPDEIVIKRIEAEIERIQALREGAFRPWYELPLLRSFGGAGTLVVGLEYLADVWGKGSL